MHHGRSIFKKDTRADEIIKMKTLILNAGLPRRRTPGPRSCMSLCLLALPMVCAAAYLPLMGPTPMRFLRPPMPSPENVAPRETNAQSIAAAPLAEAGTTNLSDTTVAALSEPVPTNGLLASIEPVVMSAKSPDRETDDVTPVLGFPREAVSTSGGLITPQMMVPFFQHKGGRTNDVAPAIAAEVVFVPPVPHPQAPSKAAYSSK
jgi:hypothetical protein